MFLRQIVSLGGGLGLMSAMLAAGARFAPTVEHQSRPIEAAPKGMVWIPGGEFSMGIGEPAKELCGGPETLADAGPIHRVSVNGFWMDATEVTNEQFAEFVAATKYVTVAERTPRAEDYPDAPPEALVAGSIVFTPPDTAVPLDQPLAWWSYVPGADWRHPEGPPSNLAGREKHPVVHIAYADAEAYARWAGKRLPTEAEWEFAARGGTAGANFPWGDVLRPSGAWPANIFQGKFPHQNTKADGFTATAPVASFAANGYGLHDVGGNVWEWCGDWYRPDAYARAAADANGAVVKNPRGPSERESFDPQEPGVKKRVQRGGSFLCTDQYCTRYMVGSRGKSAPDSGSNHAGFRCVRDRGTP